MKIKNLRDLFLNEMRDIYHAEKQILKALPKMARAASSNDLRAAFAVHLEQTQNQVTRLEAVFEELEHKAKGRTCEAMEGLVAEGEDLIDHTSDPATRDAGLIAAAQKVEHYEIATYGCLVSWAKQLGLTQAASLLQQTLGEEEVTDERLTFLAESQTNRSAEHFESGECRRGNGEHRETEPWEAEPGAIEPHEVTV